MIAASKLLLKQEHTRSSERPLLTVLQGDFSAGGVQKVFGLLANEFSSEGRLVEVLVHDDVGPLREQLDPSISVCRLRQSSKLAGRLTTLRANRVVIPLLLRPVILPLRTSATLAYLPSLVRYLKERQPDFLLTATNYVNIEAALARRIAKSSVRLVVSQRTNLTESTSTHWKPKNEHWYRRHIGPLVTWAYNDSDSVIAVSRGVADDLIEQYQIPEQKITVINNPVIDPDFSRRLRENAAHPWAHNDSVPFILFVGRLAPQKDIPTLLKAFSLVLNSREARLLILGGSGNSKSFTTQRHKVLDLASQLGVSGKLDVVGFEKNPLPYMKRCAAYVLSSRFEGFGNVLLEALAAGAPVISTDCPSGPAEILDGGRFGRLVPVGNPSALAAAIVQTLASTHDPGPQLEWVRRYSYADSIGRYRQIIFSETSVR